nr:MAG TPA: hypothetical protein [Caudoviricetes sp.]
MGVSYILFLSIVLSILLFNIVMVVVSLHSSLPRTLKTFR